MAIGLRGFELEAGLHRHRQPQPGRGGDRRDDRVGEHPEGPGLGPEHGRVGACRGPAPLLRAQILIHQALHPSAVPERRDCSHRVAREFAGFARRGGPERNFAGDRREQGQVHLVSSGDQTDDRHDPPLGSRGDEDERARDLAEIGIDDRRNLLRAVNGGGHEANVERHSLAGSHLDYPLNSRLQLIGHVSKSTIHAG